MRSKRTDAGAVLLVMLAVLGASQAGCTTGPSTWTLPSVSRIFAPAPLLRTPTLLATSTPTLSLSPQEGIVRILAGQVDPSDPSHFTFAYTVNGKPGIYDGWLKDDERVILEPRPMPATLP